MMLSLLTVRIAITEFLRQLRPKMCIFETLAAIQVLCLSLVNARFNLRPLSLSRPRSLTYPVIPLPFS